MILTPVPSASCKFFGIFFLKIESSYWYPSTTQSPSSKNYSVCSYEPLPLSNIKRCCSIAFFHFLESFAYCFIECLIKYEVFTKFLTLTINIVWKDCFVVTSFKVFSCSLRCGCQIWAQNSNNLIDVPIPL